MRQILKILIWKPSTIDICPADSPCLSLLRFNVREERLREQLQFLRKPGIINDADYTRFQYLVQRFDKIIFGAYRRFIGFLVNDSHRADNIIFTLSDISYSRKSDLPIRIKIGNNPITPNQYT